MTRAHTIQNNLRPSISSARCAYDTALLALMRLDPTDERFTEALQQVQLAREVVVEYESNNAKALLKQQQELAEQKPTEVEPEPELKVKSVSQEKAEANARVAQANKGKSAVDKAEALDVPVATVRKVEKAKAQAKAQTPTVMKAADLRKLAKELKVDVSKVDFRSKTQRVELQEQLTTQAESNKQWSGLSASRQAELKKLAATAAN